jgi:hypothetical protein
MLTNLSICGIAFVVRVNAASGAAPIKEVA